MEAKEILKNLQDTGRLVTIERIPTEVDIDTLTNVAKEIGRQFTPLFAIDDQNAHAYINSLKWLVADPTMKAMHPKTIKQIQGDLTKGLLIVGNTGTGKSLLLEILNSLATILQPQIKTYRPNEHNIVGRIAGYQQVPLLWKTYRADTICDNYQAGQSLDKFKKLTSIAIQDIGTEPKETLQMGNRTNAVKIILEHRADDKGLVTLGTTNLNISQLGDMYGERVQSRLFTLFNFVYLGGQDRRRY